MHADTFCTCLNTQRKHQPSADTVTMISTTTCFDYRIWASQVQKIGCSEAQRGLIRLATLWTRVAASPPWRRRRHHSRSQRPVEDVWLAPFGRHWPRCGQTLEEVASDVERCVEVSAPPTWPSASTLDTNRSRETLQRTPLSACLEPTTATFCNVVLLTKSTLVVPGEARGREAATGTRV